MITRDRAQAERELMQALPGMVREFVQGVPRLERLHRYAQGRHDILTRTRGEGLPNTRLVHGFARYISQVSAGYLLAEAVRYEDPEDEAGAAALSRVYRQGGAEAADNALAMQQSVYGRAVSLCYAGEQGAVKVAALDPRSAFVVYDDTVERRPLLGLMLRPGEAGDRQGEVVVYTPRQVLRYACDRGWGQMRPLTSAAHAFGRVPMVEYWNDYGGQGDFEELLPLIDAYDLLGSDRVNDRAQFADAVLVLTGVVGLGMYGDPVETRAAQQRLKVDRTLTLPDNDARAEWLAKNPAEQDIDVLRRALAQDIHKFSMTPDFSDEKFAGDRSGIALKYKLFGLETRTRLKERRFIEGLRERVRVVAGAMRHRGQHAPDPERVRIVMRRSGELAEVFGGVQSEGLGVRS